jgi:Fe-S-cluster containining protein
MEAGLAGEGVRTAAGNWPPGRVSRGEEWLLIDCAMNALPAEAAEAARQRIRESTGKSRPVVCPLLDSESGTCLAYEARPVVCRAYGFYVERREVLGCSRIEALSQESLDVVWGNHAALEARIEELGTAAQLSVWLESDGALASAPEQCSKFGLDGLWLLGEDSRVADG